jgi:polyribonucleotide nucleotidyltransferase
MIKEVTDEPEVGKYYWGTVKKIMDFGAFVSVVGNRDGLVHISQLAKARVNKVEDIVKEGEKVLVKVLDVDRQGKIKLSRKDALDVDPEKVVELNAEVDKTKESQ